VGGDGIDSLAVYSRVVGTGNSDIFGAHLRVTASGIAALSKTNLSS